MEASQNLGSWLQSAVGEKRIVIHDGACQVLLQPLPSSQKSTQTGTISAREPLHLLQSEQRLSADQADEYSREIRAERLTDGGRAGQ